MDDPFLAKQNITHVYRSVVQHLNQNGKTVDDNIFYPAFCNIVKNVYPRLYNLSGLAQKNTALFKLVVSRAGPDENTGLGQLSDRINNGDVDARYKEALKLRESETHVAHIDEGYPAPTDSSRRFQTDKEQMEPEQTSQTYKRVRRTVLCTVGANSVNAKNVHTIKLTSAVIPNTEYTVSKRNNRMYYKESTTEDTWTMVEIDEGNYDTVKDVLVALISAMNKEGKGRYNFVVDKQTGKVRIVCSFSHLSDVTPSPMDESVPRLPGGLNAQYKPDSFQMCFGSSELYPDKQYTLANILGFDVPQVYNGVVESQRSDIYSVQSQHPARLPAQEAVVVHIEEIPDMRVLVPLHAEKGKGYFYCPKYAHRIQVGHYENVQSHEQFLPNIGTLTLKLLNTRNEVFELRGAAPAVELEIESIDFIHNR